MNANTTTTTTNEANYMVAGTLSGKPWMASCIPMTKVAAENMARDINGKTFRLASGKKGTVSVEVKTFDRSLMCKLFGFN